MFLAPYNEVFSWGQGVNSFLQEPRIGRAMIYSQSEVNKSAANSRSHNVSPVVSYDSHLVETLSDVAKIMNISAGSCVKIGSISCHGNVLALSEEQFNSSDLNAVVSVKVMNQTPLGDTSRSFDPTAKNEKLDSQRFFDIYGDCYVSEFIERARNHEIRNALEDRLNAANGKLTPNSSTVLSELNALLSETETTISVSWSGGGQIKPESEEWTLESFLQATAAFPSKVAACPQLTWAVLTPYKNNKNVCKFMEGAGITIPDFTDIAPYASNLLDMFMQYKCNLSLVQSILSRIDEYEKSEEQNAIPVTMPSLLNAKRKMKDEMRKISETFDQLNLDPNMEPPSIRDPKSWAAQLPTRKKDSMSETSAFS